MAETMPEPPSLADVAANDSYTPAVPHIAGPDIEPVTDERLAAWASVGEPADTTDTTEATADAAAEAPAEATVADAQDESAPAAQPFDYAAAEAEAAAFTGDIDDEAAPAAGPIAAGELDGSSDDALNAPAAHAVPGTTRVVVLGLVSVASIATFKRSLGRTPVSPQSASPPDPMASSSSPSATTPGSTWPPRSPRSRASRPASTPRLPKASRSRPRPRRRLTSSPSSGDIRASTCDRPCPPGHRVRPGSHGAAGRRFRGHRSRPSDRPRAGARRPA